MATTALAQETMIDKIKKDMPPYLSVLLEWGQRPEWSSDGKYIYFLPRDYSDVFRIDVKTKQIELVTAHYFHESYNRVFCLHNGYLLLEGPDNITSSLSPREGMVYSWDFYKDCFQGFCSHTHSWPLFCYFKLRG